MKRGLLVSVLTLTSAALLALAPRPVAADEARVESLFVKLTPDEKLAHDAERANTLLAMGMKPFVARPRQVLEPDDRWQRK